MTTAANHRSGTGLLGVDLGTSSVKAVVLDGHGVIRAQAGHGYEVDHPHPGWSETDPQVWWTAVTAAVREATTAAGLRISAIGLSGQMHGVVLADAAGDPLRPAVLWSDSRAAPLMSLYRELPADALARLANPLFPGMFGPILVWLARYEPALYGRSRWALSPKDWIRLRLTGEIHTEPSDASATLLYDIVGDTWDVPTVDALGLNAASLPPLLTSSGSCAGTLLPAAAAEWGLPSGIPVAAGGGDTAVAAYGAAMVTPGQGQLTIGTGIQLVLPVDIRPELTGTPVTHLFRAATDRGWYSMAAALNGGATLGWVRQLFGVSWPELYQAAEQPVALDDPIFLPHLVGERTPYMDTALRGSWAYLDPRHDRLTMLRSALEGVALTTRAAWLALPAGPGTVQQLRLAGGGTTTPAWRQLLADHLHVPLAPVDIPAASGRGAALLGGRAGGEFDEQQALAVASGSATSPVVVPDGSREAVVAERFARFERLVEAQRAAF